VLRQIVENKHECISGPLNMKTPTANLAHWQQSKPIRNFKEEFYHELCHAAITFLCIYTSNLSGINIEKK
jgi:hypothetical protein